MVTINAFPEEVLGMLLQEVKSVQQLAVCRLVCKQWNPLAEKAMLQSRIVIKSEDQAFELFKYLLLNPTKGNLVKHLHWDVKISGKNQCTPQVYKHLLSMILSPNTVSLTGCVEGEEIYNVMYSIIDKFPESVGLKVTSIPHPMKPSRDYYKQLAKYSSSIEAGYIYFQNNIPFDWDSISDLRLFPRLKAIMIAGCCLSALHEQLRGILQVFNRLQELHLDFERSSEIVMSREDFATWLLNEQIEKASALEKLTISGACEPCFLEMLVFMYPNIQSISLDIRLTAGVMDEDPRECIQRIMDSIKNIRQRQLSITLDDGRSLWETIYCLNSTGLTIGALKVDNWEGGVRITVAGL